MSDPGLLQKTNWRRARALERTAGGTPQAAPLGLVCFASSIQPRQGGPRLADKVVPPDIQLKFATRAKSRIYHIPGGDHPSMIAHPEVTVAAIRDAANAVSH
jgi:hypothetical protein